VIFLSSIETIKTYDETAKSYTDSHYTATYWGPQYERFEKLLVGRLSILDVGCGGGRDSMHFSKLGFNVTGVDLSSGMLVEARTRVPYVNFAKMDMLDLKFPDESFDGIWCCASLLHIKRENAPDVLKGFNRVLKDGGVLFVSVKEGQGDHVKDCKDGNKLFFADYSTKELSSLLTGAGFTASICPYTGIDGTTWLCAIGRKQSMASEKRQ
jgi:ubiquinone/menaquinone biosynthesis C-methylase UbiE